MEVIKNVTGYIPSRLESVNIEETGPKKIIIRGALLPKDEVSRNGVLYDWESVKKHYQSLTKCSLLYNHLNEGKELPVGHFTDTVLLESPPESGSKWENAWNKAKEENGKDVPGWYYEADVNPKSEYASSILRGDLNRVSIQIMASESRKEVDEQDRSYTRAFIGDLLEASVVPTPGFMQTNIEIALAEAFKTKEAGQTTGTNPGAYVPKMPKEDEENRKEADDMFGDFPMDAFHIGLAAELKEHPELDSLEAGQLVLDHLKEDEDYYHTESFIAECLLLGERLEEVLEEK